jgi:hypothetical protein
MFCADLESDGWETRAAQQVADLYTPGRAAAPMAGGNCSASGWGANQIPDFKKGTPVKWHQPLFKQVAVIREHREDILSALKNELAVSESETGSDDKTHRSRITLHGQMDYFIKQLAKIEPPSSVHPSKR